MLATAAGTWAALFLDFLSSPFPQLALIALGLVLAAIGFFAALVALVRHEGTCRPVLGAALSLGALVPLAVAYIVMRIAVGMM
jgi:hypothetical protein